MVKIRELGDPDSAAHYSDYPEIDADRELGSELAHVIGTLRVHQWVSDAVRPGSKLMVDVEPAVSPVDQWTQIVKALRLYGLTVTEIETVQNGADAEALRTEIARLLIENTELAKVVGIRTQHVTELQNAIDERIKLGKEITGR